MGYIFTAIVLFICAILAPGYLRKIQRFTVPGIVVHATRAAIAGFGVLCLFMTSYVQVPEGNIATLNRIYLAESLPEGKVMAYSPDTVYKGPQPNYLTTGFHLIWFVNLLNDVEYHPMVTVDQGEYLILVAKEGRTLPPGEFMAPEWTLPEDEMLKPEVFLSQGGYKGTQLTVLRPGRYPIHPVLWDGKFDKALVVKTGEVAVIRSNVQTNPNIDCTPLENKASAGGQLSAPLVRNGCKGVWIDALPASSYYLNKLAYTPTIQSTRAMVWNYKGGYKRREVNLTVDDKGNIVQEIMPDDIPVKEGYADGAVLVRTSDGWTIPIELRIPYQVYPENASRVVAGVGSTEAIEDRVITPIAYDITRQIAGLTAANDLVSKRESIVAQLEKVIIAEAAKAGVTVQEVRLDEIVLPPELLLPGRRKQLAESLSATYQQEKLAAEKRAESEKAKSTADNQHVLVTAQINAEAAKKRGEGTRDEMTAVAQGQKAQRDVIGSEQAVMLQMFSQFLEVAAKNPDIIKVPVINVGGGESGSAEGMAAVLGGSSNMAAFLKIAQDQQKKDGK